MCPPLPLARRVRVAFRIGELMVHPMGSDPEQRSTFDGGDGANCKNILEPLGSLKAAMREQAMIRQANSHNGGQPVQKDGDEESAPGEEEQRRNSPKVKQCQKSGDQPVELVLVGLIFPRAVEPQDAHSGLWFLSKHSGLGCEEKLSNNAHLVFPIETASGIKRRGQNHCQTERRFAKCAGRSVPICAFSRDAAKQANSFSKHL